MADGTEKQASDDSSTDSPETSPETSDALYLTTDTDRVARIVAALRKAHAEQATAAATQVGPTTEAGQAIQARSSTPTSSTAEAGSTTQSDEIPGGPAPRRETTGVRPAKPSIPTLRWDPGARYRASRLANSPVQQPPVPHAPVPHAPAERPVPQPPAQDSRAQELRAQQARVQQSPDRQTFVVSGMLDAPVDASVAALSPGPGPRSGPLPGPVPAPPGLAGRLFRGPARRTGVFDREIWHPVTRSSRVPRDVSDALVAAVERYRRGSITTSGLVHAIGRAHAA